MEIQILGTAYSRTPCLCGEGGLLLKIRSGVGETITDVRSTCGKCIISREPLVIVPGPEQTSPTILYVDDTEAQRYAVSRVLRRAGFEVRQASSGQQALGMSASGRTW